MDKLRPLSSLPSGTRSLLVNYDEPKEHLFEHALHRTYVAKDLLFSLSTISVTNAGGRDISNVATAADLLLSDALDLFNAFDHLTMQERSPAPAEQEGPRHD